MTIKIVTDSVADLPPQVVKELGITVIPLNVRFGTDVYRDGVDITTEQFYDKLRHGKILPVTLVPSPGAFAEVYDKLAEETDEILVIVLSSKLSATYDVALQSIGLMKRKCRVEVVDSQWAVIAQGFIAITVAMAANAGASLDEVIEVTRKNIPRADLCAVFDTLEYLRRGGRIGAAQAFLGSVLKVNPIITLRNGVVEPVGRTRSRAKAIDYLYNFAMSFSHVDGIAIEDAATPEEVEALAERLSSRFPKERIYRSKTSPVIGTHTGPGLLLVAVLGDKK
ncbi:MAG: fatty acid-binding protein DegV [Dehalococcoidales bacterium]|nr:fatty acid-binding protein DegV [Dehalococcoidales bacterium]